MDVVEVSIRQLMPEAESRREMPRWAAVIVNYNAGEHLAACVHSVLEDDSAGDVDVLVVDNGSTDGSLDALGTFGSQVRVVHSGGNVGMATAANLGIAATLALVVAVLNPDTVVAPGTAGALVGRLEREPQLGIVGPRIFNVDGSTYPSARSEPALLDSIGHALFGLVLPRNRFTRRYRQLDRDPAIPREVDWLSGAAMWIHRDALDAIGGWNERYFMFMEDVDLCKRLRLRGWRVAYEPTGSVVHVEGVSRAVHPYRMIAAHHRSVWQFARDNWTGPRRAVLALAAPTLFARALAQMASVWIASCRLFSRGEG